MLSIRIKAKSPLTGSDFRLVELSDASLLKALGNDDELVLKVAEEDDEVYLCTAEKTLRVRQVHTSNLKLLVDGTSGKVVEITTSLLEATRVPARLERLREYLLSCPYEGVEDSPDPILLGRLRIDRIFGDIHASDGEIRTYLHDELSAVLINGHYRIIGAECTLRFFRSLFAALVLQDWSSEDVLNRDSLIETLCASGRDADEEESEFPAELVGNFLYLYGEDTEWGWKMNKDKICRFYARELLRARPVWRLSEFTSAWRRLANDLEPSITLLNGIALVESTAGNDDQKITSFFAEDLPLDPDSRFKRLFEVCPRWEMEKIEMYVEGLGKYLEVDTLDLIVKHCRISVDANTGKRIVTTLCRFD